MSEPSVAAPDSDRRATFRDVLAIREFRALYIAYSLSVLGDQLARIAVAVIVFGRTGSTLLTGLSYGVSYLPWLIGGPLLSGYADRKPRRSVMVVCDLARVALVLLIAIPGMPTVALITLVALVSLGEPPFASARSAMLPDLVGDADVYATAATLANTTTQLSVAVGFGCGGALVATIGAHGAILVDALTFAVSATVVLRYIDLRPAAISAPAGWIEELREGAAFVFTSQNLRWLVIASWLILGMDVSTESAAVPYAGAHGGGSTTAGLLIASLPLGMVLGALLLGRAIDRASAERMMLPLALVAPILLALTAFNPSPGIAGAVWFATGVASAMTTTANRVFVLSVPQHMRGRAFGVAVTGITTAQGVFAVLTGLVAGYSGPAHAIADLALPSFALIVIISVVSTPFSSSQVQSTTEESREKDEDLTVPALSRRPAYRVWPLIAVLATIGVLSIPSLRGDGAYVPTHLQWWWLFVILIAVQAYPLKFELRHKPFQVVLEAVPLVLGLFFLSPLMLVAVRVAASLIAYGVIQRQPTVRWLFNGASTAVSTFAAVAAFDAFVPSGAGLHPSVWPATFIAVIISELSSACLVIAVLYLTGGMSDIGRTVRVLGLGAMVGVVMTFLALFTAAALVYDDSTAWAISVFFALVVAAAQTYHRLAERAAALDRLYVVARELGHIAADPSDLAPALIQLRQVIRASALELAVIAGTDREFLNVVTVSDTGGRDDNLSIEQRAVGPDDISLTTVSPHERHWIWLLRPSKRSRRQTDRISTSVRNGDREIGILTAVNDAGHGTPFDRSDLRLLEAAADQLAAALEKGRLVESLRRAATLDTLTGLANLDSLRSFLDTTLEGSAGGVLLFLNLDRFHEVNDMLGHDAGDAVLAEVARRLESSPTHGALIARIGGDQFALAIPGAAGSEVARLAAMAVKSRVDGSLRLSNVSADIRVTIGIARAPDHGRDSATLLRRAEMAMTEAKGGSSGIGEWEPDYERDGSRRLQLLTGLRTALSDGSLRVEYQPKLRLANGDITGFEALVRWTHPELGPVSPAEFVPLAEATGLISALTSTVLRQALTTCRSWHDAGKPVGIAVNVSARSLDDNVLVGQVAAMLTASGLESRWLTLEITETSVMEDHTRSLEVLRELRMLGVRLSIDDFGTGYSSLHQLRGLPVNEVKIDRSFVETVDTDQADRAVVHAIVELCESLGLVTVAEGVEKAAQAYALDTLGVAQVQGFFHGRPMTEAAAMEWLASHQVASLAAP